GVPALGATIEVFYPVYAMVNLEGAATGAHRLLQGRPGNEVLTAEGCVDQLGKSPGVVLAQQRGVGRGTVLLAVPLEDTDAGEGIEDTAQMIPVDPGLGGEHGGGSRPRRNPLGQW